MKFLFDLLPVILFFGAYKIAGMNPEASLSLASSWLGDGIVATQAPILIATAVAMVAAAIQIALVWFKRGKVDGMLWVSFAIIVVFGGATLFFHNPTFIKWKPTALYWLFGAVLLIAGLALKRNLIRKMLEAQIQLPDEVWNKLNLAWALFFVMMGGLNLYVAYSFSEESWVNFKLFGMTGLMIAFAVLQGFYLSRHIEEDAH